MKGFRLASLVCIVLCSGPAWAGGPSEADKLFEEGVKKMRAGQFASACPDIARSQALDPRAGRLFTLAECEAGREEFPAAMKRYEEYLALYETLPAAKKAEQDDKGRPQDAKAKLAELAAKVAELRVVLAPGTPRDARVTCDGALVEAAALDAPVRLKPGEHVLALEVAGKKNEVRMTLAAGEKLSATLWAEDKPPAPPAPVEPREPQRRSIAPVVALLGVGTSAVVVGAAMEGVAASKLGHVKELDRALGSARCPSSSPDTNATCSALKNEAAAVDTIGRVGIGMLVAGGVLVAGGLTYLLWPERRAQGAALVVPVVSKGGGGLLVSGAF